MADVSRKIPTVLWFQAAVGLDDIATCAGWLYGLLRKVNIISACDFHNGLYHRNGL